MRWRALLSIATLITTVTPAAAAADAARQSPPVPTSHERTVRARPHFAKASRGRPHFAQPSPRLRPASKATRGKPREHGIASWFRTKHRMSVAHRTLPLGTKIKVSVASGRSVVVTVADRGPFLPGRVVDLSSDAFKKLASLSTGLVRVTVEVIL